MYSNPLLIACLPATSVGVRSGAEALGHDLALLLGRPNSATLAARYDLDTRAACALMPYRMSVLSDGKCSGAAPGAMSFPCPICITAPPGAAMCCRRIAYGSGARSTRRALFSTSRRPGSEPRQEGRQTPTAQTAEEAGASALCADRRQLRSHAAAKREIKPGLEHRQHKGLISTRAENSHQPMQRRERIIERFKSPLQVQRFFPPTIRSPNEYNALRFCIARHQSLHYAGLK